MKKAIVLLFALVLLGAAAFAQDAPAPINADTAKILTATVTGDIYTSFTTNLTTGVTPGFAVSTGDLALRLDLYKGSKLSNKPETGAYGMVKVENFDLHLDGTGAQASDNAKLGSWSAMIVADALTLTLYGVPSASYNNAAFVPLFNASAGYTNGSAVSPAIAPTGAIKAAYSLGSMGSVALSFGSTYVAAKAATAAGNATYATVYGDGTTAVGTLKDVDFLTPFETIQIAGKMYVKSTAGSAATAATTAATTYQLGLDFSLTPDPAFGLTGGAWYDLGSSKAIFTAKANVAAGDITAYAALDGQYTTAFIFDASAGAAFKFNEAKDSVNLDFYYSAEKDATGTVPLIGTQHQGDIGLKFVDAEGFVPGLSLTLGGFLNNVFVTQKTISVAESLSYKIKLDDVNSITPSQKFWIDLEDNAMYLNVAVAANIIANTVLTADFTMGGAAADDNTGIASTSKDMVLTFTAKVLL